MCKDLQNCLPWIVHTFTASVVIGSVVLVCKKLDNFIFQPRVVILVISFFVVGSIGSALTIQESCKNSPSPISDKYPYPESGVKYLRYFIYFAFTGLLFTAVLCGRGMADTKEMSKPPWPKIWVTLLLVWTVAPPAWFLFDLFEIYLPYGDPNKFGLFQHGQHVAGVLWLTGVTIASATAYNLGVLKKV